jgi:hypothetical protein
MNNIKFSNAKQAKEICLYKKIKANLHKAKHINFVI